MKIYDHENIMQILTEMPRVDASRIVIYCRNPLGFLLLFGEPGIGKTKLAEWIYQKNTQYQWPAFDDSKAMYFTQTELNEKWIGLENLERAALSKTLSETPLLVLDDIGWKQASDAFNEFISGIIYKRDNCIVVKSTLITTNMHPSVLETKFGTNIVSRMMSGQVIKMQGPDHRVMHHMKK